MSWADKKIPLPSFLNSDSKSKSQAESRVSDIEEPTILKCAVLKKMKGSHQYKKKFFVLLAATSTSGAKLVYFDSEHKYRAKNPPKREIVLEKCFNINRKQDSQDKFGKKVVALSLYTLDDCVQISFDDREDELNEWLEQMLYLQQGKNVNFYGKKPKPTFENVYQINVKSFKPDDITNTLCPITTGPHRLCVTSSSALLYPLGEERYVELPHPCIRNIRYNDKLKLLGLEIGRTSPSGSGLLSLDCEEKEVISQLHEVLRKAMSSANSKELVSGSKSNRFRSSSFSQERGSKPRGIPHLGKRDRERQEQYLSRNRTISEPVCEGGKAGHVTPEPGVTGSSSSRCRPMSVRYSPSILSPTSPVGSVSAGLSDDGTGSSNSINDPTFNGDMDTHFNAPEAIPEESSGEVSIEFKKGEGDKKPDGAGGAPCCAARGLSRGDYHEEGCASLPRNRHHHQVYHKKQPSLPDYMPMNIVPPPLPARNAEQHQHPHLAGSSSSTALLSSSLPSGSSSSALPRPTYQQHHLLHHHHHHQHPQPPPYRQVVASPTETGSVCSSSEYHVMTGGGPTPLSSPDSSNYLPMDMGSAVATQGGHSQPEPARLVAAPADSLTSPVLARPEGGGKQRTPSGESGYVIMSPGVSVGEVLRISEEPASLAAIEESLGRCYSSPRHSSPVTRRRNRIYVDSQRNSSCLDDVDVLWGDWRLNEDPDNPDESAVDHIGRSPVGPNDDYMLVNYPRASAAGSSSTAVSTPRPISGISPASSTSAMSLGGGTPSSGPRFCDLTDRLEKVSSYFRDTDESSHSTSTTDDKVTARPPRASSDFRRSVGLAGNPVGASSGSGGGRFMDIPSSSKSSSRSNISPFGRTPPTSSPNVASRLEGLFRNRAGSVPNKPPIFDRRRHRTQSEGEKDAVMDT